MFHSCWKKIEHHDWCFFSTRFFSQIPKVKIFRPSTNVLERPTPVICLGGEYLSSSIWNSTTNHIASQGYGGLTVEFPHHCASIEDGVAMLHNSFAPVSFQPPILVAHSLSTFLAQKYLESFALSGLILVNPITPYPSRAAANLLNRWLMIRGKGNKWNDSQYFDSIMEYYGLRRSKMGEVEGESTLENVNLSDEYLEHIDRGTIKLIDSLVNDPNVNLVLEPRSVPMFVLTTMLDREILDDADLAQLMEFHDLDRDAVMDFDTQQSRLPMVAQHNQFNSVISKWIDILS